MKWLNGAKIRLMLVGVVISGLLCMASVCSAVEYVWTQKADMPTPRWSPTSAVVNGKIYVIGGSTSEPGNEVLSTVEEYDPTTDTWTQKADMPTARGWITPSSPVVDGKIYIIGGWDGSKVISTVEEYDPATDTWIRKTDMPTRRCDLSTRVVGGMIYAIGGDRGTYNGLTVVEVYNRETDTWTGKANMPEGVWGLCACVVNAKIYALGGRPGLTAVPTVQEYDPATDTWTTKANMRVPTSQMGSAVLGNKIFVIGGWLSSGYFPYTTVQMYDPETDIWTREDDAPFLRAAFTAEVVNNRIYAIGGTDRPHPCPATSTVYELSVCFPPDFNGDEIVDIEDLIILIEHWGQDEPSVDIGPMPWGDGIVDEADLEVLMSYWGQEILSPELIAYWKLDEVEGDIAYDSAGDCNGTLIGGPAWQPTGGQVDGALELDGIDDHISTPYVLNPATYGPFSVFAWIKASIPGQVILSQENRSDWLLTNSTDGSLMTELRCIGVTDHQLQSQAVITDSQWHRVGLVWDGANRILYADDVEVASDTQDRLASWPAGLHIGAGKRLEPGSFFSGLIDDVRIYDRVVTP